MKEDYRIGKLFGETVIYAGYSLIFFGVITTLFNLTGLLLIVAGLFMALTYEGTLIDFEAQTESLHICSGSSNQQLYSVFISAGSAFTVQNAGLQPTAGVMFH
jgi:hypothetical protein